MRNFATASQPEYGIAACAYPRGPYLDVVPADPDLLDLEQQLLVAPDGRLNLRSKLASGIGPYDFVLIDCPPSIGALTQCALVAATEVIKAILALEKKAVSQVVYEVIEQTIGWEDPGGRGGRHEWVRLSLRHFQMACAMSLSQAQSGLKIAIQNGYITRRPDRVHGGYEYSIVWRDSDHT